jgi:hypothetical protein
MPFGGMLTMALISAGGSIANGLIGSNAAGNAADAQAASEQKVLDLLGTTQPQAQGDISGGVAGANSTLADYYSKNLGLLQPYMSSGTNALAQLNGLTAGGGFKAPSGLTESNDPGYQARMALGQQAVERSAAARGGALGGAAGKELTQYGQTFGSNEYGNVYNRALGTYQTNFGNLQQLAGLGLNATNTGVGAGNIAGSQTASNLYGGGQAQAQNLMQGLGISADALTGAANARASGYVGQANAITGAIGSGTNNLMQLALLSKLGLGGGGGNGTNASDSTLAQQYAAGF